MERDEVDHKGNCIIMAILVTLLIICFSWIYYSPVKAEAVPQEENALTDRQDIERNKLAIKMIFGSEQIDMIFSIPVTLTAYTATKEECDDHPEITADGTPSRIGIAALSRDLIEEFGLKKGQFILIPELGFFSVFPANDLLSTHKRKNTAKPIPIRRQVDLLHASKEAARLFGEREGTLVWFSYKKSS